MTGPPQNNDIGHMAVSTIKPISYAICVFFVLTTVHPSWGQETLKYEGDVTPLDDPILVRYRAYSKSRMVSHTTTIRGQGSKTYVTFSGYSEVVAEGENLIHKAVYGDIKVSADGRFQKSVLGWTIRIRMTERGEILKTDTDMGGDEKWEKFARLLFSTLKSMIPLLPEEPVRGGDTLYDIDSTVTVRGKSLYMFGKGVIAGLTLHKGRAALVVNFMMKMSAAGKQVDASGFGLMDLATGAWVLSKFVTREPIHGDPKGKQSQTVITLDLPPSTPTVNVTTLKKPPSQDIEERLRRVRRLLENNLITPDEAATKRKEILGGL